MAIVANSPAFFAFFMHSTMLKHPTSGLWLAADRHYLVMDSGCAGSNSVGVTETVKYANDHHYDRPRRKFKALIVEPTELQPRRSVYS